MATVKGTKQSKDALGAKGKKDQFQFDPNDLVLVVDPKHPLYDKRVHLPVKESLVRNIMAFGVIEPIVVRKNPETGEVEVVAGRQRVMACREANRRLIAQGLEPHWIPAIVRRGECTSLMGVMASENEHREDDSPVGRAEKMQRMLDMGRSEEEVAVTFGLKTAATVKQSVLLLEAPRVVRDAVESEAITPTEGSKLAKMEPEAATKALERLLKEAPRQSGKKRRANAKRAREIIDQTHQVRGKKELLAMFGRLALATSEPHDQRGAGAGAVAAKNALDWALGRIDEGALFLLLKIKPVAAVPEAKAG